MTDITTILTIIIEIAALLISAFLIPYLQEKRASSKLGSLDRWLEVACNAAEEAARKGLIDKEAKYGYALEFLEARGYTFDAADMQALIDAKVWELFNQFKEGPEAGEE